MFVICNDTLKQKCLFIFKLVPRLNCWYREARKNLHYVVGNLGETKIPARCPLSKVAILTVPNGNKVPHSTKPSLSCQTHWPRCSLIIDTIFYTLDLHTAPPTWEYCFVVMNILSYTAYRRKLLILRSSRLIQPSELRTNKDSNDSFSLISWSLSALPNTSQTSQQ